MTCLCSLRVQIKAFLLQDDDDEVYEMIDE